MTMEWRRRRLERTDGMEKVVEDDGNGKCGVVRME